MYKSSKIALYYIATTSFKDTISYLLNRGKRLIL